MAETGFNPKSVPVQPITENREIPSDRSHEAVRRVEPVLDADRSAPDTKTTAERSAEIERMASESLSNSRLRILQDSASGEYIYLMIDQDTGETVRRWPPEKYADLMEFLRTRSAGIVDQRA